MNKYKQCQNIITAGINMVKTAQQDMPVGGFAYKAYLKEICTTHIRLPRQSGHTKSMCEIISEGIVIDTFPMAIIAVRDQKHRANVRFMFNEWFKTRGFFTRSTVDHIKINNKKIQFTTHTSLAACCTFRGIMIPKGTIFAIDTVSFLSDTKKEAIYDRLSELFLDDPIILLLE